MKPIAEWRWVLQRAWSVRLIALAAILSGLETAIGILTAYSVTLPISPGVFAAVALAVTVAAFIARFVAQRRDA